ncbi:hypothetical protein IQ06DRAFT_354053 [Phaeosphaeriaceae sp. SRC1lsM3a]|nr:hypothetical protein IQ06DRAFT_354053 [Stagonospora sp. SRC1lsM3a]
MSDSNSVPNSKFDSPLQTLSKHTFPNGITAHYFISPSRTVGLHRRVLFLLLSFSPILSSVPDHATQLERNILHPTPHACSVLLTLPIYPTTLQDQLASRRYTVANESWVRNKATAKPAIVVEPLVHVKFVGDVQAGQFGGGRTEMWGVANEEFKLDEQQVVKEDGEEMGVLTTLSDGGGLGIEHTLTADKGALKSSTRLINQSKHVVKLELLTSFALSGITPFASDDAPNRLRIHRFRASWAAEGRMVTDSVENLHLERAYAGNIKLSERFGQVGSMPVRGWFPTALVEDTVANVVWGARLACPTSWQLEIGRRYDDVVFSGGYADREFGHWTKTIAPGESFKGCDSWITCVAGSVDEACERLLSVDVSEVEKQPAIEKELPIIYNDYCASWGSPIAESIMKSADVLAMLGVKYLVIDAGWYMPMTKDAHWAKSIGDWIPDPCRFPNGLKATADAIRAKGLIPGLWMEPEHVSVQSPSYNETSHLLHRDGKVLTLELRRAWDLHDAWVKSYLKEKIINLAKEAGIGYLKLD